MLKPVFCAMALVATLSACKGATTSSFWGDGDPLGTTVPTSASATVNSGIGCTSKQVKHGAITEFGLQGLNNCFMAYSHGPEQADILVVVYHGDTYQKGGGSKAVHKYWTADLPAWIARDLPGVNVTSVIREGDRATNPSKGIEKSSGNNYGGRDGQQVHQIQDMRKAVQTRMAQVGAKKVFFVGFSSGCTYGQLMMSDTFAVAKKRGMYGIGCPSNIQEWRAYKAKKFSDSKQLSLTKSASPTNYVADIPHHVPVWVAGIEGDTNTPSWLGEGYIDALVKAGHPPALARFREVPGGKHYMTYGKHKSGILAAIGQL